MDSDRTGLGFTMGLVDLGGQLLYCDDGPRQQLQRSRGLVPCLIQESTRRYVCTRGMSLLFLSPQLSSATKEGQFVQVVQGPLSFRSVRRFVGGVKAL